MRLAEAVALGGDVDDLGERQAEARALHGQGDGALRGLGGGLEALDAGEAGDQRAVGVERLAWSSLIARVTRVTRAPAGTCIWARTERISSIRPITQFISASAAGSISSLP